MKKKLIAIFAACSMMTMAAAGLVQTAYADAAPNVRIEVADGATDTEKVLTFYYEGFDSMNAVQGTLSFEGGEVTIDSAQLTITSSYGAADKDSGVIWFSETNDGGTSTADCSFATATITVPGDVDITVKFAVEAFENSDFDTFEDEIGTVTVQIPKNESGPAPVVPVEAASQDDYTGTDNSVASLWKATATADNATKATAVATLADGVTTAGGEVELDGTFSGDIEVYVIVNKASAEIKSVAVSFE